MNIFYFENNRRTINFDIIEKYGNFLKQSGVHGVLVNGVTGEGTTLRVEERKQLAEEWLRVTRKFGLKMMLAIGGVGIADTMDLAEHADKIGVDAIVLFPDLFYRPKIEEDLVEYMKEIVKYTKNTSVYYYHNPEHTKVYCKFIRLFQLIFEKSTFILKFNLFP